MKNWSIRQRWLTGLALLVLVVPALAKDDERDKQRRLERDVYNAIDAFQRADSTLTNRFATAVGYAVFPNVGKGGFVLGGAHGNGLVFERGKLIGRTSMTQVTVGAQVGGQEFAELIFFETKEALDEFKEGEFAMSAQVGAVAAAEGAAENARYKDGVLVFTRAKQGLMAEASVGGQKFKFRPIEPDP